MTPQKLHRELPAWALPVAVALGVLLLVFLGWRTFVGNTPEGAPQRPDVFDSAPVGNTRR